ncbi:ferritin-like domain-containing protein [Geomonas propionica]|uniref:Ferritin family protein n=1 Tax=Geomonas propionica TaxID=2798582 RepID=A0ABS0YT71_9BACT|nr:ferritin family protein [Geomonas propionica]MBJ6801115.1 ferritin family protein [Geomonas propionica]
MNIFDCAIKIEEETKTYYRGLEAEAMEPEMKVLFSMLAASEEEHQRKLRRLRKRMEGARLDGLTNNVCRFRPLLSQRELLEETGRDPNLYRFAVANEEQDIRFYEELASAATDQTTRKGLLMLAQEERRHLQKVTNIYSFVETPKTFLAWSEFSNRQEL